MGFQVDPDDSGLWIKQVQFNTLATVVATDGFE
jgi:hypothetical protein